MSTNLHMYLERHNKKDNVWDAVCPFLATRDFNNVLKTGIVDFWPYNGSHELFEILDDDENFPSQPINAGTLSPRVKAFYEEAKPDQTNTGYYGFHCVNFADLENYYLHHALVVDYEADWGENWQPTDPKPMKDSPLKRLVDKVHFYAEELYYDWFFIPSEWRLIYWFDC